MNKQQKIADLLLKYLLPDALKPEYDGMTAYELAGKMLETADDADREGMNPCAKCGNPFLTSKELNPKNGMCRGCDGEETPEELDSVLGVGDEKEKSEDMQVE